MRSFDPIMEKQQRERIGSRAAEHRLDEPAKLSLGMVASRQSPLLFHPARLIVAPPNAAVSKPLFPKNAVAGDIRAANGKGPRC